MEEQNTLLFPIASTPAMSFSLLHSFQKGSGSRIVELYLHSPICLHDVMLN
jgi:hypothetical protein